MKGLAQAKEQQSVLSYGNQRNERKHRIIRNVIFFNCLENFLLFLMLLINIMYPNASSALYLIFAFVFTASSLAKEEKKVMLKFVLSIALLVIGALIILAKGFVLIKLNHEGEISLSADERLLYDSLGIRIDSTTVTIKFQNTFLTLFFDILQMILSLVLVVTY